MTSTDPKAQNDLCGTADPVTGALVLSARDPDGKPFLLEHVFDPCQVGSNGEKIDLCASPDKIFRCVGNSRLAESHLTTSNQDTFGAFEIYLEDLALLGVSDELVTKHGFSNQGNPVLTWAERIGCVDHSSDLHASICEFYVEVKFLIGVSTSRERSSVAAAATARPHCAPDGSGAHAPDDDGTQVVPTFAAPDISGTHAKWIPRISQ